MPEDPNSPNNPLPSNADADAEFTDADWTEEWTEDSSYASLEGARSSQGGSTASSLDEWDEAEIAWEDESNEPVETVPQATTAREALAWIQPAWRRSQRFWQRLIIGVRNRIPAAANLSDTVLSAILVGILAILLVLLNSVRQPSTARPHPAAETPPLAARNDPTADLDAPLDRSAPAEPSATSPTLAPSIDPENPPLAGDRIAQIQAQMTDSAILNAQRVIDSVQADLVHDRLTLVVNGDWYRLSDYDQTQLAQALKEQSQALSFKDLQLQTRDGAVIARSPVIGEQMVILQRERPPQVPTPERPRFRLMIDR